jgi:hypothetical protein
VAEPVKQEVIELGDEQYDGEQGAYEGEEEEGGGGGGGYTAGAAYQEEGAMVPHGGGEEGLEAGEGAQGMCSSFIMAPILRSLQSSRVFKDLMLVQYCKVLLLFLSWICLVAQYSFIHTSI